MPSFPSPSPFPPPRPPTKAYYAKMKPLKLALYKAFLSEEYKNKRAWSLKPADGVEQKWPIGMPSQFEVAECIMLYGFGKKWEQYVFPGTKAYLKKVPGDESQQPYKKMEDPWHNIWEMSEIDRKLEEIQAQHDEEEEAHKAFSLE